MRGLMMDRPLLISTLIEHAAQFYGDTEVISRTVEGPIHRYGYAEVERRSKRLANALKRLGISQGDRVATMAWNGYRHLELYFGVSGIGAICHTINPRLFDGQIDYIVHHATDKVLFLDLTFLPLVERLSGGWTSLRHIVLLTDREHMPETSLKGVLCYEELIGSESDELDWPEFDENAASSLCYTSGTTGSPKGALYSHRSTLLHSYAICMAGNMALSMEDSLCPVVPMFHANAWGVPYGAAMAGSTLVLPGPKLDGASLQDLFATASVTMAMGVPTIWLGLLKHLEATGGRLDGLQRLLIGGSAAPPAMIAAFEDGYGVEVIQGWGMTEMSPVGTLAKLKGKFKGLPKDKIRAIKATQGRPLFGVEMKLLDAEGKRQPHDGESRGEVMVRGPWVISGYFDDAIATAEAVEAGWLHTGDVAVIDPDGYMQIVDRRKDVIKSGGEWVSSIDIENAAIGHPDVAEAAAIGLPHPRWGERPLLAVVAKEGRNPVCVEIQAFLKGRLAPWAVPDDVVLVEGLPHTATGKIHKVELRRIFKDHRLPTA